MTTSRLTTIIGWGLTILMALMPIHAASVITLGHFYGHQSLFAAWKEVFLLILSGLSLALIRQDRSLLTRLKQPIVSYIGGLVLLALCVTLITRPNFATALYGVKTDFEFLLAALIALLVASKPLYRRLVLTLLGSSAVVVIFALVQATILPHDFLLRFGYTFLPGQTAPYETVLVGSRLAYRFGSTLGGPNQLGTFLITPLVLTLLFGLKKRLWWLGSLAILPAIFLTYSRGAWLGAAAAVILALVMMTPLNLRWRVASIALSLIAVTGLTAIFSSPTSFIGRYIHHPATTAMSSDSQHVSSLQNGVHQLIRAPFGHGLGTAGPATFHGGRINIIENNYLQIGYEIGLSGLLLFGVILGLLAVKLLRQTSLTSIAVGASIIGISLTALFLPAWTDSSSALTVFILGGAGLGVRHV
jgi:hypothetical protein